MGRRRGVELYRAPFPLYALRVDPKTGLLIAAGGGGAARTGIKNGVHFLQLEQINGCLSASLLHSHDTETRATMNLALAGDILAAGQDARCQLLRFQVQQQKGSKAEKSGSKEQGPRQRKGAPPAEKKSGAEVRPEGVELRVKNLEAVQTDFSPEPLQKAVCFNHDNTLLATGGSDGHVRVWKVPSLEKVLEFKAHEGEIEDLALGPDGKLVTVGWDFKASVWHKDQLVTQLQWQEEGPTSPDTPYRYQACRCEDCRGGQEGTGDYCSHVGGLGRFQISLVVYDSSQCRYPTSAYVSPRPATSQPGTVPPSCRFGPGPVAMKSSPASVSGSVPVWLLLLLCVGLIIVTILLLQSAFPGFL
ncbi:prolactin regulatory element-binding protein isoform X2 [Meriones unguiculatus]|uniref:prolactin regulatory element-binding protein isoform X2 n=1 Tax=Meriones unguiculatus TaxID=10047 RepID=UPI00293F0028|nr:prolactin regulatory element-binding protein isoform X2 [Meriones unguiculatus]